MITRTRKEEIVAELTELLKPANGIYFVNFESMSVAETVEFRKQLREKDITYKVAKNNLLYRAIEATDGLEMPKELLFGQTGVIVSEDAVAPAKIIQDAFKKNKKPVFKAALLEGELFDGTQLDTLAALPSKEELIASIIGSINAPVSGIVGAINAVMRDVASVIEEVAKKQNEAA